MGLAVEEKKHADGSACIRVLSLNPDGGAAGKPPHTYTMTDMRACTHAYTHAYIYAHTRSDTLMHTDACARAHTSNAPVPHGMP